MFRAARVYIIFRSCPVCGITYPDESRISYSLLFSSILSHLSDAAASMSCFFSRLFSFSFTLPTVAVR